MLDFSNRNIDKTLPCISISQVLEQIQEPFDKIGVSEKVYKNILMIQLLSIIK